MQILSKMANVTDVRAVGGYGFQDTFNFFFDELVPCVAGRKIWTRREKGARLISDSRKVISVLDKAWTILALENYWPRWINKGSAVWTDSRQGNYQYMGWAPAAYTRFDTLCERVRAQRLTEHSKELETAYLAHARKNQTGRLHGRDARLGAGGATMEVYNELDDDED
jgi:hypothetical protein